MESKTKIPVLAPANEIFEFNVSLNFKESLRLDSSNIEIKSLSINPVGHILLFIDNKIIIKLNQKGEIIFEKEINPGERFGKFWTVKTGLLQGCNEFYVNNFIIKDDNTCLELPLITSEKKTKKLFDPHVIDVAYSVRNSKYYILYEDYFITYSNNGQIEKQIKVGKGYYNKIIVEKEWLVIQKNDKSNLLLDFDGNVINAYDFGNGNCKFEFSNSFEYLICFGYSVKSQFYQLPNKTKKPLWAHPTFIKDYKEKLYNDVEHNFGMQYAKFSPDETYLIGGAYHGKYVAWKLPSLERIELIPQQALLEILPKRSGTRYSEHGSTEIITDPEIVKIENQTFLKNRGNGINNICFFENGDLFLTALYSGFILAWDRKFENINFFKCKGRINFYSKEYMIQITKDELIVYIKE